MNSFTPNATICSVTVAPPILTFTQSCDEPTATNDNPADRTVARGIAAVVRTLATWLPMSGSSTPSSQAISTLSQRDRLGERH